MCSSLRRFGRLAIALVAVVVCLGSAAAFAQAPAQDGAPARSRLLPPPAPADVAAIPADAEKSPSGLAWKVLKPGKGDIHPWSTDKVTIEYDGWTAEGRPFVSTTQSGKPGVYTVGTIAAPKGLAEAVQLLTVGERRRFWMPENIAFEGAAGKPKGMCVFEVELTTLQAQVPADVAAPPKEAKKTKSGLAYKVIHNGAGKTNPKRASNVTVHYTGFTTDGQMFDSSRVQDGEAKTFQLDQVIPGWTEGVQLMKEGDIYRFWIPQNLAYGERGGQNGIPAGMLVFDVELLAVK
jgi:peptidylprolyl isomerase